MAIKGPDSSFKDDSRGVSAVIGFILMFAILIILLSINQAQFVPQENSEIEYQHFKEVRNDMVQVRSSISTAGQANVSQYPTVKLGTGYPVRLFAVNPPPSYGSLETSEPYDIQLNDLDGASETVATRFLVYRDGYNELDIGPIWYEHSVLYIDERSNGGGIAIYEDQNIITGNNSARVTALQNDFNISSTGEVTVELYPTKTTTGTLSEMSGKITLKIPTRLNGSVYWNGALGELNSNGEWEYHGTEPHPEESIWWLNLTVNADSLKFNTVGIDSEPTDQGSASQGVGPLPTKRTDDETEDGNQLVFNNDAVAKDGPDLDSVRGGVEFTVTNQFGQNAEILSVEVTSPTGPANGLDDQVTPNDEPQSTEIYVAGDANDGWVDIGGGTALPETFDMDTDGINNNGNPEVTSGGTFNFYLYEFEQQTGGFESRRDMSGRSFDVTLEYQLADGTTNTKTFTVNVA